MIGPRIDAAGGAERPGASQREVARLTGAGYLHTLVTADGATVYPQIQLTYVGGRSMGIYLWAIGYHRGATRIAWRIAACLWSAHPCWTGGRLSSRSDEVAPTGSCCAWLSAKAPAHRRSTDRTGSAAG